MAAIVEWVSFAIFNLFANYTVSTIIAFILATTANYFLGKAFTFKNYQHKKKDIISVFVVSGIGLLLNILFMFVLIELIKLKYEIIAKIISTGLVFIWNYISRRLFVYKKELVN
jgi:putative flippase GtrA